MSLGSFRRDIHATCYQQKAESRMGNYLYSHPRGRFHSPKVSTMRLDEHMQEHGYFLPAFTSTFPGPRARNRRPGSGGRTGAAALCLRPAAYHGFNAEASPPTYSLALILNIWSDDGLASAEHPRG